MAASMVRQLCPVLRSKFNQCSQHLSTSALVGAGHRWRAEHGASGNWTEPGNSITDSPDWSYADGRPGCLTHRQKQRVLKQMEYAKQIVKLVNEVDFAVDYELKQDVELQVQRQKILDNKLQEKGALLQADSGSKPKTRRK